MTFGKYFALARLASESNYTQHDFTLAMASWRVLMSNPAYRRKNYVQTSEKHIRICHVLSLKSDMSLYSNFGP